MARDRHRAARSAVIGAVKGEDARPARRGHDRARHGLVGVRAGMAEPDAAPRALRHDREQPLGELDGRQVRRREVAGAGLAGKRPVDRLADGRMRMAEGRRAPGGGEVEQPPSVVADEKGAFPAGYRQRKEAQEGHPRQRPLVACGMSSDMSFSRRTPRARRAARRGNRSC